MALSMYDIDKLLRSTALDRLVAGKHSVNFLLTTIYLREDSEVGVEKGGCGLLGVWALSFFCGLGRSVCCYALLSAPFFDFLFRGALRSVQIHRSASLISVEFFANTTKIKIRRAQKLQHHHITSSLLE